ncbi:MAG: hypothetical protein LBI26_02290 [Holosporales bacterium]|jgi:hypothetical protein|nr:hypothetical protein [Holosporales bacterium]
MILGKKNRAFFQILLFDKNVILQKLSDNTLIYHKVFEFENINDMFLYINKNPKLHIEIVINNVDSLTKNIFSNNMRNIEIKEMLRTDISNKNGNFNTSFYCKNTNLIICNTNLNKNVISVFNRLLSLKNHMKSVSCWPIWVVYNYFSFFSLDFSKFSCSLFVIKYNGISEIISVSNQMQFICHRRFEEQEFDENEEIANTLKYSATFQRIDVTNIAVYVIDQETLNTFVIPSKINMNFVSNVINEKALVFDGYSAPIKLATKTLCLLSVLGISLQTYKIISLNKKITEAEIVSSSVPDSVINEMNLWEKIGDTIIERVNFFEIVKDIVKNTENKQISFLKAAVDQNDGSVEINIETLDREQVEGYTKSISSNGYKFSVNVSSEDGIVCSGKHY